MKARIGRISFLFFGFALCFLLNACMPKVNMKNVALLKSDMNLGSVVVGTVSNKRTDNHGSDSFESLGTLRGGFGNPFRMFTKPDRDLNVVLKEITKTSLEHTGYSTNQATGTSSRLDIDVLYFWVDGYVGYQIKVEIVAKLIKPSDETPLAQKRITVKKGFLIGFGSYNPLLNAFDYVYKDIQSELVAFMQSQEFQDAAK